MGHYGLCHTISTQYIQSYKLFRAEGLRSDGLLGIGGESEVQVSDPFASIEEDDSDLGSSCLPLPHVLSSASSCLRSVLRLADVGGSLQLKVPLWLLLHTAAHINHTDADSPSPGILASLAVTLPLAQHQGINHLLTL